MEKLQMFIGGAILQQFQLQQTLEEAQKRILELEAKLAGLADAVGPVRPNATLNGGGHDKGEALAR